ncbi:Protein T06F4.1 a, partial [Aphelenchoides avenae]
MADDLRVVAGYLGDIRICFILFTVSVHIALIVAFGIYCMRRKQRKTWKPQHVEELTSVRTDGNHIPMTTVNTMPTVPSVQPYMRNHRKAAPTFMRHGVSNHAGHNQSQPQIQEP